MPRDRFLTLDDVILPPPLPAVMALLVVAGLAHLGWRLARRLRRGSAPPLEVAAGFVVVTGTVGAAAHALALAQLSRPEVLRPFGWALAAIGALEIAWFGRGRTRQFVAWAQDLLRDLRPLEQIGILLALLVTIGLMLGALGPPTDADSLDYHLGVALDWLRHGGAHPGGLWLHARLVGLGDALNMLGLATGTDTLGAVLQAAGLVVAVVAVGESARGQGGRVLALLMTVTSPALLFLVPNQKPQLLPAAATTIALVLLVRAGRLEERTLALALASAGFAIGCKYSFILTGGVVLLAGAIMAWRRGVAGPATAIGVGVLLVMTVPVWARNWTFYGDPFSPFLERFRATPDPFVALFATNLRDYGSQPTLLQLARLPVGVVFPSSSGTISTVLGIGVLAVFTIRSTCTEGRWLATCAVIAAISILFVGQVTPRFFLEPYLWLAAAAAASNRNKGSDFLLGGLCVQGALMVALAGFAAIRIFPGALSPALRHAVMSRSANGYDEARWIDQVLPRGAVIVADMRSHALVPRPFVVLELRADPHIPARVRRSRVCEELQGHHVTGFVLNRAAAETDLVEVMDGPHLLAGPTQFRSATRNPYNAGTTYYALAYAVAGVCR